MYLSHMKFRRKQRHFLLYPSFHFTVFASTKHKNWNTIPKCSLYVDLKTWAILASSNLKNTISIDLVNDLLDFLYMLKKVPVTLLKVPVTIFKKSKSARDKCPWHLCPWHFQDARDNFRKSARDIEKVPVTKMKIQNVTGTFNVTGKKINTDSPCVTCASRSVVCRAFGGPYMIK